LLSVAAKYSRAVIIRADSFSVSLEDYTIPCPNCGKPLLTEKYCPGCGTANPISYIDESVKVSKTRVVRRQEKAPRPTRIIIIGVVIAAALFTGTFLANNHALNSMQLRMNEFTDFDVNTMSSRMTIDACNPTAFPAGFDKLSAAVKYKEVEFAVITIDGDLVMPYQSATFEGQMKLNTEGSSNLIFLLAQAGNESFNENDLTITATMDAKILGIVPYSQSMDLTFAELQLLGNSQPLPGSQAAEEYSCG
jgi:hypothetical protein